MAKERALTGKWQGFFPGDWVRPRSNPGTWMPLIDVAEVFPGNRSVSRQGVYNLYDAPIGVELKIEEAAKAPIVFDEEAEWEKGGLSPGDVWCEDGRYHFSKTSPVKDLLVGCAKTTYARLSGHLKVA